MNLNTSGFYSKESDQATELLYSGTSVYFPDGTFIFTDHYEEYSYPVNGWYWFDSDTAAYAFWNMTPPSSTIPGALGFSLLPDVNV